MNKLGELIIEDGIKEINHNRERQTVRGVILNNDEVILLYSKMFNDYTFPGGGIKEDEDHHLALKRELEEEIGAVNVNIIKPLGYTEEIRYGINSTNNTYYQKSFYYLVEVENFVKPKYVGREKEQGLERISIKAIDAINHNNETYKIRDKNDEKGYKTVLKRENLVLKHLIDNYEKI